MRSGDLAEKAGVNKETLRFYERRGLLRDPQRTDRGYRTYNDVDLHRMQFIKNAQKFGFSLDEVGELLAIADGAIIDRAEVRQIARLKVAHIERQIEYLNQLRATLNRLIYQCNHAGPTDDCPIIESLAGRMDIKAPGRKKS